MAFFKRGKHKKSAGDEGSSKDGRGRGPSARDPKETSPQRVGTVSGVLSSPVGTQGATPFGNVVARRFGPQNVDRAQAPGLSARPESADDKSKIGDAQSTPKNPLIAAVSAQRPDHLRAVERLFSDHPATPELEVDAMAHIGRSTTITGNIVAEEDLEIQGTVEGSVRLANHQVTVGNEGHVKANVEANVVMVYGRITGNVVASDLVEIEKGGIVGGDIKAPRVIMHDGAIVVGGLNMSASLPKGRVVSESNAFLDESLERPYLKSVEPPAEDALERFDV